MDAKSNASETQFDAIVFCPKSNYIDTAGATRFSEVG